MIESACRTLAAAAVSIALAGCASAGAQPPRHPGPSRSSGAPTAVSPVSPVFSGSSAAPVSSVSAVSSAAPVPAAPPQLPRGGRTILPGNRVVAYYGGPNGPALGVLGSADPDSVAARIEAQAAQYAPFGRPVLPAMELIATVARPCSQTPLCSAPIGADEIQRYLDAAHRHRMLLILDFQPGRGEFLPQVQADERFLTDPSVSVGLDPEWKLGPGQEPMRVIGSASAASVNAVAGYLSGVVHRGDLPDKLLVLHEFRPSMLPDREHVLPAPGLEEVVHADGFGSIPDKLATYRNVAAAPPFFAGFKLFFTEDSPMMTPADVMALSPQPDLVTYQ